MKDRRSLARLAILRRFYFIPLLFVFSCALVCLSSQSSYASTGYLTGDINDFDGFINSNPFYTNTYPTWVVRSTRNSGNPQYNGYSGNLPSLCMKQDSSTATGCTSNSNSAGNNLHWFLPVLTTPQNGYDLNGIEFIQVASSFSVPNEWKGHKVALTLYLGFSWGEVDSNSGETIYTRDSTGIAEMNWGALEFINVGSSNTCNDLIQSRMLTTDATANDFVVYELDYSEVGKDTNCVLTPKWAYGGDNSHGYAWRGVYSTSDMTGIGPHVHNPYIGYDVIQEGSDDLGTVIDDWKQQQGDEWLEQQQIIADSKSDAQTSVSSLNLSFTVLNVLTPWLNAFTANNCVDIPTMASMIHLTNSRVCSPWPASVRTITSPVMATFGTVMLSFFIYRWLMKREDQEIS